MKFYKNNLLIYLIMMFVIFFSLRSRAQENLVQCFSIPKDIIENEPYYENLDKIINNILEKQYIVEYIVKPTFSPEYAFQIVETDNSGFEISAIYLQENLWYSKIADSVKIHTYKRTIDKDLTVKIDRLFKLFLDSIPNKIIYVAGNDGISYQFKRQENNNIKCGETWSPYKDSPVKELVTICDIIMDYVKGEDISIQYIANKIDIFFVEFK
jgi:hypothetical protein